MEELAWKICYGKTGVENLPLQMAAPTLPELAPGQTGVDGQYISVQALELPTERNSVRPEPFAKLGTGFVDGLNGSPPASRRQENRVRETLRPAQGERGFLI